MSDADGLRLPDLGVMRRYLRTVGWKSLVVPRGDLELFTRSFSDGTSVEIVLPTKLTTTVAERLVPALRTIAALSNRDVKVVAADIAMFDFDVMRTRLPDSIVLRQSIPLRVAEKFTGNARRLLASASAAEQKRAVLVSDSQKLGAEYANKCRFGHTFQGSFGFTIESPAGPAPDLSDEVGGAETPPPFERRIFERIATGIAHVHKAAIEKSPEPLEKGAAEGFNVNMLEDFTALLADTSVSAVTFGFAMTPQWSSLRDQFTAEIPQDALPLIDRVLTSLRPSADPALETVVGQVIGLATREIPTDFFHEGPREITIDGTSIQRGTSLVIKVRLSPEDYLVAYNAHGGGKPVSVTGVVTRSSRGNVLTSPTRFREV